MNFATQQQFDASPERIDITISEIVEYPILKDGVACGTTLMVEYSPAGSEDMVKIPAPIEQLLGVETIDDPHSVQHNIAKARAAVIQRYLAHHQHAGQTPDGHVSLEAWSGLTPVMCKSLRKTGVRSLQELANASEHTISRLGGILMNPRKLIEQCQMYLSSMDKTQATAALADAVERNRALESKVGDLENKLTALLQQLGVMSSEPATEDAGADETADAPRRRGRPKLNGAEPVAEVTA